MWKSFGVTADLTEFPRQIIWNKHGRPVTAAHSAWYTWHGWHDIMHTVLKPVMQWLMLMLLHRMSPPSAAAPAADASLAAPSPAAAAADALCCCCCRCCCPCCCPYCCGYPFCSHACCCPCWCPCCCSYPCCPHPLLLLPLLPLLPLLLSLLLPTIAPAAVAVVVVAAAAPANISASCSDFSRCNNSLRMSTSMPSHQPFQLPLGKITELDITFMSASCWPFPASASKRMGPRGKI